MDRNSLIYVAGHRGLVGQAICRRLCSAGYHRLLARTSRELDLRNQRDVQEFFDRERPDYVFLAAAKVGGILANSAYPADFLLDNLSIQSNVIDSAYRHGTKKLVFLGSSCVYPKFARQPICEEALLSGPLEPTNEWYAIAKIAGIKMVQAYRRQFGFSAISLMPANVYGPGDNFDLDTSHVLPALLRKAHKAKLSGASELTVWGSGSPMREFLHVDDLADAALFMALQYDEPEIVNVGTGTDITILDLAEIIKSVVGFKGPLVFDNSKPDGTPRKVLDISRMSRLGWKARIGLEQGIAETYRMTFQALESLPTNNSLAVTG